MSFEVSPSALDAFADLLDRYSADADAVWGYIGLNAELSFQEEGFLGILFTAHGPLRARFEARVRTMSSCGSLAAMEVRQAATWYRDTDKSAAADLDAAYPPGERDRLSTEDGETLSQSVIDFLDQADPGAALKVDLTVTEADQPEVHFVEQEVRAILDMISPLYWIRTLVKDLYGSDPVDWVTQWLVGDWQAWARCAKVWLACSGSVGAMELNLSGVDEALAQTWSGNATDAAMGYFQKLTAATGNESTAFALLCEKYRAQTEIVFHCLQIVNDLLNMLVDYLIGNALEAAVAAMSGPTAPVTLAVETIQMILDRIGQSITGALDLLRVFQVIAAAGDMPDIPDSQVEPLLLDRYDHPRAEQ